MRKSNKRVALVLCAILVCTAVLSFLLVADKADHDCAGDDCAICLALRFCESVIRSLGLTVVIYAVFSLSKRVCSAIKAFNGTLSDPLTPVFLCVKLTE